MSAKTPAKGHTAKHAGKKKHGAKAHHKHHPVKQAKPVGHGVIGPVHTVGLPAKQAKPRGFSVGDVLPVCSLEAVAQWLRLAGQRVSDDEVAGLWELYGELSIPDAIAAFQQRHVGIVDAVPLRGEFGELRSECLIDARKGVPEAFGEDGRQVHQWYVTKLYTAPAVAVIMTAIDQNMAAFSWLSTPLILGVDTPGPHAVLATADGWWSWGELYDPWPCRVEEAWEVAWA